MAWCDFVTDTPNGFGVLHCLGDKGHKGEHYVSRKPLKNPVWRRFTETAPVNQQPSIAAEDLYGEPITTNQPEEP